MLLQPIQDHVDVSEMFFLGVTAYNNIVDIHNQERINILMETTIHQELKGCRRTARPNRHHQVFELSIYGVESRLFNIGETPASLMRIGLEVNLGKITGHSQTVKQFTTAW